MEQSSLSRDEVTRGLRAFIGASALWGASTSMTGISTPVFTGYALSLGADESAIALFYVRCWSDRVNTVVILLVWQTDNEQEALAYEREDAEGMAHATQNVVNLVPDSRPVGNESTYETLSSCVIIVAINNPLQSDGHDDLPAAQEIFLTVCLGRMAALLKEIKSFWYGKDGLNKVRRTSLVIELV